MRYHTDRCRAALVKFTTRVAIVRPSCIACLSHVTMISVNSPFVDLPRSKPERDRDDHNRTSRTTSSSMSKQSLLYLIVCEFERFCLAFIEWNALSILIVLSPGSIYVMVVIGLLVFLFIRGFKYKNQEGDCYIVDYVDTVIAVLTLLVVFLSCGLLVASFKYVFAPAIPAPPEPLDKTEDFIRRNSVPVTATVSVNRNPSVCSHSWMNCVRLEAYETQRRMSTVPQTSLVGTKSLLDQQSQGLKP